MRGTAVDVRVAELESTLWVALATAGAASTGGMTSLIVLFAVAIAIAWTSGQARLTAEIAGFSLVGLVFAAIAGAAGGSWMDSHDAATISSSYGALGLALLGVIAAVAASERRKAAPVITPLKPVAAGNADPAVSLKLKQLEMRAREAEAGIAEAKRETDAANARLEARTTFFAQTSHELRTPLNAIVGFAEMMAKEVYGPLPERYQEYAGLIHEGGRNLSLIVDDVLDLSRLEAGRYDIFADEISLTDLAAEAVHFMSDEADRKGVTLELADHGDVEAFADSKAVRQIALNLISNGLKFTPSGGNVMVAALDAPGGAILAVSDSGVGISPEELNRLSRAFEQGEAGKRQKGAGLGLSVVRAFAELHGGRLDIESREGGGTTISVFFPGNPGPGKTGMQGK
ncbi:MAG TPA: HAMP domain-containing sensor histidine kinase [Hyphomonadaceae bacterium]|nr:HAMP domain-containing sensor histidine kinase [Hyphomonadaceae bacterium]